jgi:diadenylate cyclase
MQLEETMVGVMGDRTALVRDYSILESEEKLEQTLAELAALPHHELLDFGCLAELLGYDRKTSTIDLAVSPRGYRALSRIPRLPRLVVQKIVHRFGDLDAVINATEEDLESVDGVGSARAREIREGLRTLQEVDIVDRYP